MKRTQASIVRLAGRRAGDRESAHTIGAIETESRPTKPAAVAVAPPFSVPLFVPAMSLAFPSPGHQPRPDGAAKQLPGTFIVSVATVLVTDPAEFATTTE